MSLLKKGEVEIESEITKQAVMHPFQTSCVDGIPDRENVGLENHGSQVHWRTRVAEQNQVTKKSWRRCWRASWGGLRCFWKYQEVGTGGRSWV